MTTRRSSIAVSGNHSAQAADPIPPNHDNPTVGDCKGLRLKEEKPRFNWRVERGAAPNYERLGAILAKSNDLYRDGEHGLALIQVLLNGKPRLIAKGKALAPVIVDRVRMQVTKEGKLVSELPATTHLNAMLRSEAFLANFLPLDEVTTHPIYMDDFTLAKPGYNDGGPGNRILYLGPIPKISDSMDAIKSFLGVMAFASLADRSNTVGAAVTRMLRRCWPGAKPLVLITGTKSHCGKGTVTDFIRGNTPMADILYEAMDWPMQSQLQRQLKIAPDNAC